MEAMSATGGKYNIPHYQGCVIWHGLIYCEHCLQDVFQFAVYGYWKRQKKLFSIFLTSELINSYEILAADLKNYGSDYSDIWFSLISRPLNWQQESSFCTEMKRCTVFNSTVTLRISLADEMKCFITTSDCVSCVRASEATYLFVTYVFNSTEANYHLYFIYIFICAILI